MPKIRRLNPEGMHPTPGYAHVTIAEGNRRAYLAGQCPLDLDGTLIGVGDLDAQVDQVVNNSLKALAHVDAAPDRVIRSVIYVGLLRPCGPRKSLGPVHALGALAGVQHGQHAARGRPARLRRTARRAGPDGAAGLVLLGLSRRGRHRGRPQRSPRDR